MSLEAYRALDLSLDGPLSQDLLQNLAAERNVRVVTLSPPHAASPSTPAMLTPRMLSWYQSRIAPVRVAAVQEVRKEFEQADLGEGESGFLLEQQQDEAEQRSHRDVIQERKSFIGIERNRRHVERLKEDAATYHRFKLDHGREPVAWRPWRYWIVLFLFGLLEALINWESFLKIPNFTPFFATAWTIIVWMLISGGSHILGETLKQSRERFGANVSKPERRANFHYMLLGLVAFFVAMFMVMWGRWFFLEDVFIRRDVLGERSSVLDYLDFGGSLLGNLALFLVGMAWSWWIHDTTPNFAESRRRKERIEAKLQRTYDKSVGAKSLVISRQLERTREQLKAREAFQARHSQRHAYGRDLFSALSVMDGIVVAVLQNYRNLLCEHALSERTEQSYVYNDFAQASAFNVSVRIDASAYMAVPLRLPYAG